MIKFVHKFQVLFRSRIVPAETRALSLEFALDHPVTLVELRDKLARLYPQWSVAELQVNSIVLRAIEGSVKKSDEATKPLAKKRMAHVFDIVVFILKTITEPQFTQEQIVVKLAYVEEFATWKRESLIGYVALQIRRELKTSYPRIRKIRRGLYETITVGEMPAVVKPRGASHSSCA